MTKSSILSISRLFLTGILVSLFAFSTGCIVRPMGHGRYGHHHHHHRHHW